MAAVPIFYDDVRTFLALLTTLVFLVVEVVAFVHCLTQRADAFPVVGSLSKAAWLAILAGAILLTLLCGSPAVGVSFFGFIAVGAALIYLLDVRPALRDAASGNGSW
jgi:hypothetical protein